MRTIPGKKLSRRMRSIATVVLVAFGTTLCNDYARSMPVGGNVVPCVLPSRLGSVVETFQGRGEEKVYCIQDVHCNAEVQRNIVEIIAVLKKKHGDALQCVGVEGTVGKVDTELFAEMPRERAAAVEEYALEHGYLPGAQLYGVTQKQGVEIMGLEEEGVYAEEIEHLTQSFVYQEKVNAAVRGVKRAIERGKRAVYDARTRTYDEEYKAWEQGKITIEQLTINCQVS